ncbi:superoxide dismutase family protein [Candidatus Saccharibacteria bacterium CPR2]|nr:superoxide dismutase family protein [Candidatus Saccharibacteria bacterium CPR2]
MKVDLDCDDKRITARAEAQMLGDEIEGKALFMEYDVDGWKYVRIILDLKGDPSKLQPGKHAVHIHEKGECKCEGFKCAGGHFDPGPFGNTDPDANHGFHSGDLPSINIDSDGKGHLEAISTRITLSKGPVSIIYTPSGTSLMVHANPDPYAPGESGSGQSGGPRLACGVIKAC